LRPDDIAMRHDQSPRDVLEHDAFGSVEDDLNAG
jgi:hypothetical protein